MGHYGMDVTASEPLHYTAVDPSRCGHTHEMSLQAGELCTNT